MIARFCYYTLVETENEENSEMTLESPNHGPSLGDILGEAIRRHKIDTTENSTMDTNVTEQISKCDLFWFVHDHDRQQKINCVKNVRTKYPCGLKEAKDYVEHIFSYAPDNYPLHFANGSTVYPPLPNVNNSYIAPPAPAPEPPVFNTYSEAADPVNAARKAFLLSIHKMLACDRTQTWTKRDIVNQLQDDLTAIKRYLDMLD